MRSIWTNRRVIACSAVVLFGFSGQRVWGQSKGGGAAPSTGSTTGSAPSPTRGNPGSIPRNYPNSNSPMNTPGYNRPIFLAGKVMFDDGKQPNTDIRIERVCGGIPRLESHTDSKGRFSFQVGQNMMIDTDASDPSTGGMTGRSNGQFNSVPGGFGGGSRNEPLWNCELRASYPGYRSDVVELASRRSLDDPDVGVIVLHHLANVQGSTLSLTTALAPKHAQKEYEKGVQAFQKGKLEDAEKHLLAATDTYPKYAVAWFALGQVQQKQGKKDEARKSYQAAIDADGKYVSPYDQLALLAANDGKWQETENYSRQVIRLNPVEFPDAFWVNAIANYNLKKPDEAEKSAKEVLKLDTAHRYPEAEGLLGEIMLNKGNYSEAAAHLRTYLTLAPNSKNADQIKQVLAKIDQANTEAKK